jgi:hypothetical protein
MRKYVKLIIGILIFGFSIFRLIVSTAINEDGDFQWNEISYFILLTVGAYLIVTSIDKMMDK